MPQSVRGGRQAGWRQEGGFWLGFCPAGAFPLLKSYGAEVQWVILQGKQRITQKAMDRPLSRVFLVADPQNCSRTVRTALKNRS